MKQWLQELWDEHKEFIGGIVGIVIVLAAFKLLTLLSGFLV